MEWIYENNEDNTSRYVLGTVGKKPLICIGINPSTAEPNKLDPTLKSVDRISAANGFDSWIMINVYPQRATNPNDIHTKMERSLHYENLLHIERVLKEYRPTIWAAWGTNICKRPYLVSCLADLVELSNKYSCKWVNAGENSKQGHPHHPLYLDKFAALNNFDIDLYLKKISVEAVFAYINIFKSMSDLSETNLYKMLRISELIDQNYDQLLTTSPIDMNIELRRLDNADFALTRALITAILRENHFSEGAFVRRIKNGDVVKILRKMRKCYQSCNV